METYPDKPIFARPLALAASDETRSSTSSERPKRTIPRKIANLIGKVGLRYEPSVKSDLEAHAARVALLAEDMANADPAKLEEAIRRHVSRSPYLPKASDLNEIMDDIDRTRPRAEHVDVVGIANERLEAEGKLIRWAWNNPEDRGAGTYLYSIAPLENNLVDLP